MSGGSGPGIKVAVLGAGGTIAPAIVRDLAASEEVGEMLLLDLDRDRARKVADEHGGGKARAAGIDARSAHDLADALRGAAVLVNSASYRINLDAMRACLAAHCHYLDLGGLYHVTAKQLELGREYSAAGLTAVLGIGSAPGKTNLMAQRALDEIGGDSGRLDAAHVSAAGRDVSPPDGESFPYALQTLLDEVTMAPVTIRDGEPMELPPLSDGGTVDFGEPIGKARAIHTLHSEMLTFPASFGCAEASFRLSLADRVESRLRELAGAGPDEVAGVAASAHPPSGQTFSVHIVDAVAGDRSIRVRSVTPPHQEWGLGGGIVSTASPIAASVRLIAQGAIDRPGVHPPERCIDPGEMFAELETRGVRFGIEECEDRAQGHSRSHSHGAAVQINTEEEE